MSGDGRKAEARAVVGRGRAKPTGGCGEAVAAEGRGRAGAAQPRSGHAQAAAQTAGRPGPGRTGRAGGSEIGGRRASTSAAWLRLAALALGLACTAGAQPKWYLGATAGYGLAPAATARQANEQADTGFRPGATLGVVGGQDLYEHLSGEFRYLFRFSDLKVAQAGTEVRFAGRAHLFHYDLLIVARRRSDPVRPFVALGGGVKLYQGTGEEAAWQPLSRFAILTRTRQVVGMASFGGGVRIRIGERSWIRWELRDCLTPFPKTVIAPGRGARIEGWVHDLIPMASIGVSF